MPAIISIVVTVLMVVLAVRAWQRRRRGGGVGAGAAGAFYEMLDEDKRAAIEVIVDERTAYRDPETRDGKPLLK